MISGQKYIYPFYLGLFTKVIFIIYILVSILSCNKTKSPYGEDDCTTYDYSNCIEEEPLEGNLSVKVSLDFQNYFVPIEIYEGKYKPENLLFRDTLYEENVSFRLPVHQYYSVLAKYKSGDKYIYALDGDRMGTSIVVKCDSSCWIVTGGKIDLRLQYSH